MFDGSASKDINFVYVFLFNDALALLKRNQLQLINSFYCFIMFLSCTCVFVKRNE